MLPNLFFILAIVTIDTLVFRNTPPAMEKFRQVKPILINTISQYGRLDQIGGKRVIYFELVAMFSARENDY